MRLPCLFAVLTVLTVPLFAEQTNRSEWQYDAVMPEHVSDKDNASAADINGINDVLAKIVDRWNAHDVDGYLSAFWNSPQLLVIFDNQQFQGWDALKTAFKDSLSNPDKMGRMQPLHTQIRISKSDLALVQDEWVIRYQDRDVEHVGSSTMTVQKVDGAWKIISSYSRSSPATSRGWEYDSIAPERSAGGAASETADVQAINTLLVNMDQRWNAHDIDGYMSVFWKSPGLFVVVQAEQYQGWDILYRAYKTGFPDPSAMGTTEPSRVQIKRLSPDFAIASNWWSVTYPNSKVRVVGNSMMDLQKFSDGWKIIAAHSSLAEP
jgi:uncharacterized protein (TIGR02246 family)